MHHKYLLLPALLMAATACFADLPRLAVTDFTVGSDNPELKYVGKGLAEMVAFELHTDDGLLSGRADVILDEEGGMTGSLAIVDYKVGAREDLESRYEWQLCVYSHAAR